jgi:hypothetical protein
MACRVRKVDRISTDIGVAVQVLRIREVGYNGIGCEELVKIKITSIPELYAWIYCSIPLPLLT